MDEEYQELENEYFELAARLRAKFIERFLMLEDFLTEIIALYFCPDPKVREQFYSILYPELFYAKKVKILFDIIYSRFPQEIDVMKPKKRELIAHNTYRNTLAHSMLDRSTDFVKMGYTDRIRIRKYSRGRITAIVIKESDIDKKIEKMKMSYLLLTNIEDAIRFDREFLEVYAGGAGQLSENMQREPD